MKTRQKQDRILSLSPAVCFAHIQKYSQYARNESWARWYAHVAPLKAQRVVKVLQRYKDSKSKLLDLGCGTGLTFTALSRTFKSSIALDIGDTEINATKELLKKLKISAVVKKYDGRTIPFPPNTFDVITSIEVIEHVNDPVHMLKEIRRVLKKDGILHITTANKWWPIEPHFKLPFLSYLPAKLSDIYVRLSGRGDSYHNIKLPSYHQFRKLVEHFFFVDDITLDVIRNFKTYGLDKERGTIVTLVALCLKSLQALKKPPVTRAFAYFIEYLLNNASLGWLFIAYPKR